MLRVIVIDLDFEIGELCFIILFRSRLKRCAAVWIMRYQLVCMIYICMVRFWETIYIKAAGYIFGIFSPIYLRFCPFNSTAAQDSCNNDDAIFKIRSTAAPSDILALLINYLPGSSPILNLQSNTERCILAQYFSMD